MMSSPCAGLVRPFEPFYHTWGSRDVTEEVTGLLKFSNVFDGRLSWSSNIPETTVQLTMNCANITGAVSLHALQPRHPSRNKSTDLSAQASSSAAVIGMP